MCAVQVFMSVRSVNALTQNLQQKTNKNKLTY